MKTYRIRAERIIDAKNIEEAEEIFANESDSFAAEADIQEVELRDGKYVAKSDYIRKGGY